VTTLGFLPCELQDNTQYSGFRTQRLGHGDTLTGTGTSSLLAGQLEFDSR